MGKVVKFCAACEEGFAERFGFCPNCGGSLTAYEMNPLAAEQANAGAKGNGGGNGSVETKTSAPITAADTSVSLKEKYEPDATAEFSNSDEETKDLLELGNALKNKPMVAAPATVGSFAQDVSPKNYAANGNGSAANGYRKNVEPDATMPRTVAAPAATTAASASPAKFDDGLYHITFVEEQNASSRNLLLLGSLLLVTVAAFGGVIWSLYQSNAYIGSLTDDSAMLAYVGEVEPEPVEEQPLKKNEDKGGGGGGGGKENPEPATKGRLPTQVDKPIMPPQPLPQVTNASLPNPQETQGKIKRDRTDEPVGTLSGALSDRGSSGPGSGGGIGNGRGSGVGNGIGTGEGNGIGSGSGNGRGNGIGDGTGDGRGSGRDDAPPPVKPKGPTIGVQILSKPRPSYTDAARQNQVTGVVRLRVTFLASGQIGGISPVSGLPNGLTEQAIAAARQIRFEPAKRDGVPQTVTKQIEYSFSIY